MYSLPRTQRCLKQGGFAVRRAPSDDPRARELYVSRPHSNPDAYPNVYFFDTRGSARGYAEADSVPLIRRGNVVLGWERSDDSVDALPAVRALTRCLRRTL